MNTYAHKIAFDLWTYGFYSSEVEKYSHFLSEEIDKVSSFEIIVEDDPCSRSLLVSRDETKGFRVAFNRDNSEFTLMSEGGMTGERVPDVMAGYQSMVDGGAYVTKNAAIQCIRFFVAHLNMDPSHVWIEQ